MECTKTVAASAELLFCPSLAYCIVVIVITYSWSDRTVPSKEQTINSGFTDVSNEIQ